MQKIRRDMLSTHTFPRKFSMSFNRLNDITIENYHQLSSEIHRNIANEKSISIKPLVMFACGNIFTEYFTTRSFERSDKDFQQMITNFDKIFWWVWWKYCLNEPEKSHKNHFYSTFREVNQGSVADFLPFLLPFKYKNMKKMEQLSHEIRHFILNQIITDRYTTWNIGNEPNDYIESLIDHVKQKLEPRMEWETVSHKKITKKVFWGTNKFILLLTKTGIICTWGHNRWTFSRIKFRMQNTRICCKW